jgi:uncharacterized protein YbbC (DUF1343 family)
VPVLSLYGADPSRIDEALRGVEALVVDLPDVGCRYYTYPWTVRELLRRAARHALPVTLLDRPNPLGGAAVEGSVPDPGLDSPVCASPVPVRHGLTMGELALWNHSAHAIGANLSVVPMAGWRRSMLWDGTGLAWVAPSPALPSVEAALVYPGTCLLEGTNVSEGRGTDKPFQVLGAPFLDAAALVARLSASGHLAGVALTETSFTPASSKWAGQTCRGVRIEVRDAGVFRPVAAGVAIVAALCRHAGFEFRPSQFDALAGTGAWRRSLEQGAPAEEIVGRWRTDEAGFWRERAGILLY